MVKSLSVIALVIAFCMLTAPEALASRARILVMGTGDGGQILWPAGNGGSLYFDDDYNAFYNPAYLVTQKNWAIFEKSNYSGSVGRTAQAGAKATFGPLHFGAYFNRVGGVVLHSNGSDMHPVDLLFGYSLSESTPIDLGLGLTYGSFNDGGELDTSLWVNLGLKISRFEPFLNVEAVGNENTSDPDEKHTGFLAGMRVRLGRWTPYAAYRKFKTLKVGAGVPASVATLYGGGASYSLPFKESINLIFSASYWRRPDTNRNVLPIDFSGEWKALGWLALRSGFSFRAIDQSNSRTLTDSTTMRVGASFQSEGFEINLGLGNTVAASTSEISGLLDAQQIGIDQGLIAALSLGYKW